MSTFSPVIALVPLRGGSKSIPHKNIKQIGGRPLCHWVLRALHDCEEIDRVIVSTDSPQIASVVRESGTRAEVLMRPDDFATDSASTESVMLHCAEQVPFDVLCTVQATSPLTTPGDLRRALAEFRAGGFDSMLTAVRVKRFFWEDGSRPVPLNYDPLSRPRRQDFQGTLMENGAFYLTKRSVLEHYRCRLGGQIGVFEMSPETASELDEPGDWEELEARLWQRTRGDGMSALERIRLVVLDVDGTLTDAGMYYDANGDALRKFNTRDAKGLALLQAVGVNVAIVSTEDSAITRARATKLGLSHCYTGVQDKARCVRELASSLSLDLSELAFVGDDINDLPAMELSGLAACPADAVNEVKKRCHVVLNERGGQGAVREFADMLRRARANTESK